jgi:hypothetical protein
MDLANRSGRNRDFFKRCKEIALVYTKISRKDFIALGYRYIIYTILDPL